MAKKVSKPTKRKGYQQGGYVGIDAARERAPQTPETQRRWEAANDAIVSARYNQLSPEDQARFRAQYQSDTGKLVGGRDKELARADYPGFAKGGKVRKVAKAAVKRKR